MPASKCCFDEEVLTAFFKSATGDHLPGSGKVIDLSEGFFRLGAFIDWLSPQRDEFQARVSISQRADGGVKGKAHCAISVVPTLAQRTRKGWGTPGVKGESPLCDQCGSHSCAKDAQEWGTPALVVQAGKASATRPPATRDARH
jgi:hypothetical protein